MSEEEYAMQDPPVADVSHDERRIIPPPNTPAKLEAVPPFFIADKIQAEQLRRELAEAAQDPVTEVVGRADEIVAARISERIPGPPDTIHPDRIRRRVPGVAEAEAIAEQQILETQRVTERIEKAKAITQRCLDAVDTVVDPYYDTLMVHAQEILAVNAQMEEENLTTGSIQYKLKHTGEKDGHQTYKATWKDEIVNEETRRAGTYSMKFTTTAVPDSDRPEGSFQRVDTVDEFGYDNKRGKLFAYARKGNKVKMKFTNGKLKSMRAMEMANDNRDEDIKYTRTVSFPFTADTIYPETTYTRSKTKDADGKTQQGVIGQVARAGQPEEVARIVQKGLSFITPEIPSMITA